MVVDTSVLPAIFAPSIATGALTRSAAPPSGRPSSPVVVLGHSRWQYRYDGDSSIVGRTVAINNHDFTVIGVYFFRCLYFFNTLLEIASSYSCYCKPFLIFK